MAKARAGERCVVTIVTGALSNPSQVFSSPEYIHIYIYQSLG